MGETRSKIGLKMDLRKVRRAESAGSEAETTPVYCEEEGVGLGDEGVEALGDGSAAD